MFTLLAARYSSSYFCLFGISVAIVFCVSLFLAQIFFSHPSSLTTLASQTNKHKIMVSGLGIAVGVRGKRGFPTTKIQHQKNKRAPVRITKNYACHANSFHSQRELVLFVILLKKLPVWLPMNPVPLTCLKSAKRRPKDLWRSVLANSKLPRRSSVSLKKLSVRLRSVKTKSRPKSKPKRRRTKPNKHIKKRLKKFVSFTFFSTCMLRTSLNTTNKSLQDALPQGTKIVHARCACGHVHTLYFVQPEGTQHGLFEHVNFFLQHQRTKICKPK